MNTLFNWINTNKCSLKANGFNASLSAFILSNRWKNSLKPTQKFFKMNFWRCSFSCRFEQTTTCTKLTRNKINTTQWGMKHPDPNKKKTVGNALLILKGFIGITPAKKCVLVTWSTFANVLVKSEAHFSLMVSIQQHTKKEAFLKSNLSNWFTRNTWIKALYLNGKFLNK